jgi:hypothetical protein
VAVPIITERLFRHKCIKQDLITSKLIKGVDKSFNRGKDQRSGKRAEPSVKSKASNYELGRGSSPKNIQSELENGLQRELKQSISAQTENKARVPNTC